MILPTVKALCAFQKPLFFVIASGPRNRIQDRHYAALPHSNARFFNNDLTKNDNDLTGAGRMVRSRAKAKTAAETQQRKRSNVKALVNVTGPEGTEASFWDIPFCPPAGSLLKIQGKIFQVNQIIVEAVELSLADGQFTVFELDAFRDFDFELFVVPISATAANVIPFPAPTDESGVVA